MYFCDFRLCSPNDRHFVPYGTEWIANQKVPHHPNWEQVVQSIEKRKQMYTNLWSKIWYIMLTLVIWSIISYVWMDVDFAHFDVVYLFYIYFNGRISRFAWITIAMVYIYAMHVLHSYIFKIYLWQAQSYDVFPGNYINKKAFILDLAGAMVLVPWRITAFVKFN